MIQSSVAKALTVLLHPILMPVYAFLILLNLYATMAPIPMPTQLRLVALITLITVVIPILLIATSKQLRLVSSYKLESNGDRYYAFLITAASQLFCWFLIRRIPYNIPYSIMMYVIVMQKFLFAAALSVILNLLILYWWRISSHAIGIGGLVAGLLMMGQYMMADIQVLFLIAIFAAGLVGFARLQLNAHNPLQVYGGYFLGFAVVSLVFFYF